MRALLVATSIVACSSPPAPPPLTPSPAPAPLPPLEDAIVVGRVMREGGPALHFGVLLVPDTVGWTASPQQITPFHETDGRFRIEHAPGRRQIVIVGPGFARKLIPARELKVGTNDLGDIAVEPGFTIRGRVRDPAGSPVAEATISIDQISRRTDDPLLAMAYGNYRTTTDKQGDYIVYGVSKVEASTRPRIRAWTANLGMAPTSLPLSDQVLDFTLEPAGTLEGTSSRQSLMLYDSKGHAFFVEVTDGSFRVEGIPADTYYSGRTAITVVADTVTTVQLH